MENSQVFAGLDIGTTKIACIIGRKNEDGKIEVLGHAKAPSIGVKRGVVINIENTVNSIKTVVREAQQQAGIEIEYVSVGIAGQHIKSLQHHGGTLRENSEEVIRKKDIEQLLNSMYNINLNPGEEVIDVIPQEYIVDNEQGVRDPVGMLGKRLEANFHIIVGQTTAAKNITKCVKLAGLKIVNLILEPIASARSVLTDEETEAGVALVDIGGGTTDLAIFYDGIIRHTAVIPFGGDIITEDVKEGCSIIRKHAEELKVRFGSALSEKNRDDEIIAIPGLRGRPPKEISMKNLASIIQARVEEIIEQVYYEIKNSGYERKLSAGIVLTGGGSMLRHIGMITQFITGMDCKLGLPDEFLADDVEESLKSPIYSTTIGLVLVGMDRFEKQMQQIEKERKRQSEGEDDTNEEEVGGAQEVEEEVKQKRGFLSAIKDFFEKDDL